MKLRTLFYLILLIILISAAIYLYIYLEKPLVSWLAKVIFSAPEEPIPNKEKCGLQDCHGLNISCGKNVPDVCSEVYQLGDGCRKYANCQIINGKCGLVKKPEFDVCKACVEKCEESFKNNLPEIFDCEGRCLANVLGETKK